MQFYQTAIAAVCKVGEWGKLDEALQTVHTESFIRLPDHRLNQQANLGQNCCLCALPLCSWHKQGVQLGPQSQLSGNTKGEDT